MDSAVCWVPADVVAVASWISVMLVETEVAASYCTRASLAIRTMSADSCSDTDSIWPSA